MSAADRLAGAGLLCGLVAAILCLLGLYGLHAGWFR